MRLKNITTGLHARVLSHCAILFGAIATAWADQWPMGDEFPIGMYTVGSAQDMQRVAADGFNLVHTYGFTELTADQYMQTASQLGIKVMLAIGAEPDYPHLNVPAATAANVQHFSQYASLGWWYYTPEEPRFWVSSDMQALQNASATIRANDPLDHPIFTYHQNHYTASNLANYTPYLDGIGAGAYANFVNKPRPWVRWRIEQDIRAIQLGGNRPGQFPVAVLQMFPWQDTVPMTGADAYHDSYLSLVSGARAILIYGDAYRTQVDPGIYQSYKKVAGELNGAVSLGEAFLKGHQLDALKPAITAGPLKSAAFSDSFTGGGTTIQYDSVSHRTMVYRDHIYLSAVNSATSAVTARFDGIRANDGDNSVEALFEARTTPIGSRSFSDTFTAIGVHNYRLPRTADLVLREDHFDFAAAWKPRYGNGTITVDSGIATVQRGSAGTENFYRPLTGGSVPEGGFLELRINADPDTEFYLQLVGADLNPLAVIDWQAGTGQWQTVRAQFDGQWWDSNNSLWLGIRGGDSYMVDSLGIYFRAISTQQGDTDFDGDVDLNDLSALASSYGKIAGGEWRQGDFDGDGDVDLSDLGILASHYGAGEAQVFAEFSAMASVPEPATIFVLLLPMLGRMRRNRRTTPL